MPYQPFLAWQVRLDAADREASATPRYLGAGTSSLALHLLIAALVTGAPAALRWADAEASDATGARTAAASPAGPVVAFVAPLEDPTPGPSRSRERAAGPTAAGAPPPDLGIHMDEGAAMLRLRGFTFDVRKLTTRAASLFPFLTRPLALEPPASRTRAKESLVNPFARRNSDDAGRPLTLTDAELQALIDKAWSRRERWEPFQPIAALASGHSPDAGRVPELLRGYVTQNGLQIYVDPGIRDPRLWVQLGLVADHASFIDYISRFAARHPSTKATTELLFLVDKLAQGSFDGLVTLLDIDPVRDLRWTRDVNREAYDALVVIRRHYASEVARRGFQSRQALAMHFDAVRLSVLDTIVRTTPDGYRANDARFLMGEIYWRHGRRTEAVRIWAAMRVDAADGYAAAVQAIRSELFDGHEADGDAHHRPGGEATIEPRRIDRILEAERSRWVSLSYDRLRRFGYHFDTF